jgi:hypothetical protein
MRRRHHANANASERRGLRLLTAQLPDLRGVENPPDAISVETGTKWVPWV